ncbi:MAG: methyltransferase domain-containing protein, partial [Bryobacteraceae bacterium]
MRVAMVLYGDEVSDLTNDELKVARHYDDAAFDLELERLPREHPVEFAITRRWLERIVKSEADVAEIVVGGGHYSEVLVRKRCFLQLVDVSGRLLEATASRLRNAGLEQQILGVHLESATRLESLQTESVDAALPLGPLYHLQSEAERRRAVAEAARILRPTGILFAAGINRLAY